MLLGQHERGHHRARVNAPAQAIFADELEPLEAKPVGGFKQVLRHGGFFFSAHLGQRLGVHELQHGPEDPWLDVLDAYGAAVGTGALLHGAEELRLEDGRPRGEHAPVSTERLPAGLEHDVGGLPAEEQLPEVAVQVGRRHLHKGASFHRAEAVEDDDVALEREAVVLEEPELALQLRLPHELEEPPAPREIVHRTLARGGSFQEATVVDQGKGELRLDGGPGGGGDGAVEDELQGEVAAGALDQAAAAAVGEVVNVPAVARRLEVGGLDVGAAGQGLGEGVAVDLELVRPGGRRGGDGRRGGLWGSAAAADRRGRNRHCASLQCNQGRAKLRFFRSTCLPSQQEQGW